MQLLASGVVAGSQQNTASSLPLANDMTCSWCAQNTILTDQELLDAVCCTNLCNLLNHLGVVEAAITTNDEEGALDAFGNREENRGDEGLAIMRLLEDLDLLPETRSTRPRGILVYRIRKLRLDLLLV